MSNGINLRFSDISEDEQGKPSVIKSHNLKVNRILGRNEDNKKGMAYIPVTAPLQALLKEMDYEKHRNSERFLIAPDSNFQRNSLMNVLSRSFSHYWQQTGIAKELNFADLRKTFISELFLVAGTKATMLTGHSNQQVLNEHYISNELLAKEMSKANLFPALNSNGNGRQDELKNIRERQKSKSQTLER